MPGRCLIDYPRGAVGYLNEFTCRLNRRFWEDEIPKRLLRVASNHLPVDI